MRFGQLPSVREMTPDITPLLQARQMKDQAYQNIARTVAQFSAEKEKKELEKKAEKRGIAAITPFLDDLARRSPKLANIDPKKFYKTYGDEALSEIARYMQASASADTAAANVFERQRQLGEALRTQATATLTQKIEQKFGHDYLNVDINEIREAASGIAQEFGIQGADISKASNAAFNNINETAAKLGDVENQKIAVESGINNTIEAFNSQESLIDTAKDVYKDLQSLRTDPKAVQFNEEVGSQLSSIIGGLSGQSDDVIIQNYTRIASLLRGTGASAFTQKLGSLAGRIANTVLQGTRASSKDGSSGYGQLTGPELDLLKGFYGALVTSTGLPADFDVIEQSLERILTQIPDNASRRFLAAEEQFGLKESLGYSREGVRNNMLESLRNNENFDLFDLESGERTPFRFEEWKSSLPEQAGPGPDTATGILSERIDSSSGTSLLIIKYTDGEEEIRRATPQDLERLGRGQG